MEASFRWIGVTAVAPVAWGANYYVTRAFLPADHPLWGAALRALPAGVLLLAVARERPRGVWWWRSAVLGVLNTSAFFVLVYVASQWLVTSTASMVMALSPVVLTLGAWALLGERPRVAHLVAAGAGLAGVVLMLGGPGGQVRPAGVVASVAAMLVSAVGFLLSKRWDTGPGVPAVTAWQLTVGGVILLAVAGAVEGAPPMVDGAAVAAFAYTSVVATALAFLAWFAGLRRLPAGTVGLIGLLNPVTGVLLGTTLAGEGLGFAQVAGMALVVAAVVGGRRTAADGPASGGRRGGTAAEESCGGGLSAGELCGGGLSAEAPSGGRRGGPSAADPRCGGPSAGEPSVSGPSAREPCGGGPPAEAPSEDQHGRPSATDPCDGGPLAEEPAEEPSVSGPPAEEPSDGGSPSEAPSGGGPPVGSTTAAHRPAVRDTRSRRPGG